MRDQTIRFYLLIDHRIVPRFDSSRANGTRTHASHFGFLVRSRTGSVPYFLSRKEEDFSIPSSLLSSLLLLLRPRESVSYHPLKFLPDECGVAHGKDRRCQLRGTGSWRLISSSDHSRMNRSTWATMLRVLLWVADYERMTTYCQSFFPFLFCIRLFILILLYHCSFYFL